MPLLRPRHCSTPVLLKSNRERSDKRLGGVAERHSLRFLRRLSHATLRWQPGRWSADGADGQWRVRLHSGQHGPDSGGIRRRVHTRGYRRWVGWAVVASCCFLSPAGVGCASAQFDSYSGRHAYLPSGSSPRRLCGWIYVKAAQALSLLFKCTHKNAPYPSNRDTPLISGSCIDVPNFPEQHHHDWLSSFGIARISARGLCTELERRVKFLLCLLLCFPSNESRQSAIKIMPRLSNFVVRGWITLCKPDVWVFISSQRCHK